MFEFKYFGKDFKQTLSKENIFAVKSHLNESEMSIKDNYNNNSSTKWTHLWMTAVIIKERQVGKSIRPVQQMKSSQMDGPDVLKGNRKFSFKFH